jgi:hypothetical protein
VAWGLLSTCDRWGGIGTDIAAGIELAPLLFVPFLLVCLEFPAAYPSHSDPNILSGWPREVLPRR